MQKINLLLSVALAATLAACGGGGAPDPSTPGTSTPVSTASTIVTSVVPPTYATGSEELAAFTLLNAERQACGFGQLAQDTRLDTAARGHADWQLINNIAGHYQDLTRLNGFTGITPNDRIIAAGYSSVADFVAQDEYAGISGTGANSKSGKGAWGVRGLLNAPYHAAGLISGFKDVGFSVRNAVDAGSSHGERTIVQINPAHKNSAGAQLVSSTDVLTYPCAGSTGIDRQLVDETPNPVPGRNLATNPLGSSIQIMVRRGNTLVISGATMVANGQSVTLRPAITAANDPNSATGPYLYSNQGFVSADAPLQPNTLHQVTVTGTNNGTPFSRTFSFTTGS